MFFDHYPYTNFHNVNLDWVLQAVKAWGQTVEANDRAFQDLKEANEDFKAYVTNYLQDLDITDEINTKLDAMLASGVLTPYFAPYVQGYVNSWLNSHVTPTSPALDNTLTLSGAAARADSTGKRLKDLAYIDALSTPEVIAALNRSQVLPGYRVQGITYDYDGHYYVCGGSVDETGTGVIVKMTKPDFTDAEITEIPQLGHANDITYYDGYLYVCTVGGGDAPQWGIYKINVNDFTDKTLISNAPENTIGISYRQGDFWILAPYRIYRTTDFTSYEVVVANTNDLLTAYGIPTSGRISQTIFRAAGYLIGWVCSFVFEDRHYGALTFFNSAGEAIAFKMFPAYHTEIQGAVYADMSIYLVADGNMVNVFRMDPRHLSYVQLKAGDDLNSFTGRGTLYSTGSNVSAELLNSPSSGEGFTVQVDRLGVYNTIQTARTNSGRELYRIKSFNSDTWGEWIEPAAEVAELKEDLIDNNSIDLLRLNSTYTSRTVNGITFTWNNDHTQCAVSGTATATAFTNLYYNLNTLPEGIIAGETYHVKCSTTDKKIVLFFMFYDNNGQQITSASVVSDRDIIIPSNAVGCIIRLTVTTGNTVNGTVSNLAILWAKSNKDLENEINNYHIATDLSNQFTYTSRTSGGVTFTWNNGICYISGEPTSTNLTYLYLNETALPDGMEPGQSYYLVLETNNQNIYASISAYNALGTCSWRYSGNGVVHIPKDAVGLGISLRVEIGSGNIPSGSFVRSIHLYKGAFKYQGKRLLVSIIDDDTSSTELVTKFHDACMHNGIKGNYSIITKRLEDGVTSADTLLTYEDEGFGMLVHAYDQNGAIDWGSGEYRNISNCRANLSKGLRQMREYGFNNYKYWITPGGHYEQDIVDLARFFGMNCLISTANNDYNHYDTAERWFIKRISFNPTDDGRGSIADVKARIDNFIATGGNGWLIITTHFNEWGSLTWDDTLDANGYPIGYSRFNDVVSYAIHSGCRIVPFPVGWTYFEPYCID